MEGWVKTNENFLEQWENIKIENKYEKFITIK